jgi:hypothetical protein
MATGQFASVCTKMIAEVIYAAALLESRYGEREGRRVDAC